MACKGKCETEVIAIHKLIGDNRRAHEQIPRTNKQIVFWLAVLGLFIMVINVVNWLWGEGASAGYAMTGGTILLMAFFYHAGTRKKQC